MFYPITFTSEKLNRIQSFQTITLWKHLPEKLMGASVCWSNSPKRGTSIFYCKIPHRPGLNPEINDDLFIELMDLRAGPMCSLFKVNKGAT